MLSIVYGKCEGILVLQSCDDASSRDDSGRSDDGGSIHASNDLMEPALRADAFCGLAFQEFTYEENWLESPCDSSLVLPPVGLEPVVVRARRRFSAVFVMLYSPPAISCGNAVHGCENIWLA